MAEIAFLRRYPVKGLTGEPLARALLSINRCIEGDRGYAIEAGLGRFDDDAPRHLSKAHFLQLMSHERLASLDVKLFDQTGHLVIARAGRQVARGDIRSAAGRREIEDFLAAFTTGETPGRPRIVSAPGINFTDVEEKLISIVGLPSVADLERAARAELDPMRFRANVYVSGTRPWEEFDWVGGVIAMGAARLAVVEPIERCAATEVDPSSGKRDLPVPRRLLAGFGHQQMGVYAKVIAGGMITEGDPITIEE